MALGYPSAAGQSINSGYADQQKLSEPQPESPVQASIFTLSVAIDELDMQLNLLQKRLVFASKVYPPSPKEEGKGEIQASTSALVSRINQQTKRVSALTAQIRFAQENLEL